VRVLFEDSKMAPIDQNVYLMDGGVEVTNKEFTYAIENGKKGLKLKPQSIADITGPSTSSASQVVYQYNQSGPSTMIGSTTTTTTTTSGTSTTTTTSGNGANVSTGMSGGDNGAITTTTVSDGMGGSTTTTTTTTTNGNGANVGMNVGGVGISINVNDGMGGSSTTSTTTTTTTSSSSSTTTSGNTSSGTTTQSAQSSNQCVWPMSSSDFANAKASVQKQSFEDGKLKVAKQILNTNCMSTAQVKEIMGMFTMEDTKLDWAKYAYGKTTDPNNYYQLNDGFSFSSSTDELDEYIKQHPHQ
jgi:hypothetical protein